MKLVADIDIPFLKGVFNAHFSEIVLKKGVDITPRDIENANALIIRTRTICNEELLKDSRVKIIATATIGTDHIDLEFCKKAGIAVYSAPGCNAGGVVQWVLSAIYSLNNEADSLKEKVLGVVGVGNIGSKLVKAASALGMEVLQCDPPRQRSEQGLNFVSLKEIAAKCDIISFHVPLTFQGVDATYHMADDLFFRSLKPNASILNSSRGGVVDEIVLLSYLQHRKVNAAMDVWENEPTISESLLKAISIATPHIAGYSLEGKVNATVMVVNAISNHFKLGIVPWAPDPNPSELKINVDINKYIDKQTVMLNKLILNTYPIGEDDYLLRSSPVKFEEIRNTYNLRREYSGYSLNLIGKERDESVFKALGFGINNQ